MGARLPTIVIVVTPTRLQGLLARWGTKGAARFRMKQARLHRQMNEADAQYETGTVAAEADYVQYENEDTQYQSVVRRLREELDFGPPVTVLERQYLSNYDFRNALLVVVTGPDGLVANTAKYAKDLPIVGVNPDPSRNDGVLLPVAIDQARRVVKSTIENRARIEAVSLAKVTLNDGQSLLAFNDFFVGRRTHVSARYNVRWREQAETQSSSGIIVSTGAGATGWLSSVQNMVAGMNEAAGCPLPSRFSLDKGERRLAWVVREPFASRHSQATMVFGWIDDGEELMVESLMSDGGVIFSDGIESDFLEFNSGTTARISLADQQARLVLP